VATAGEIADWVEVPVVAGAPLAAVEEAIASTEGVDDEAVSDWSVEVATALVEVASSAMAVAMLALRPRRTIAPIVAGRLILRSV
jgi:hypothetical protein